MKIVKIRNNCKDENKETRTCEMIWRGENADYAVLYFKLQIKFQPLVNRITHLR